MLASQRCWSDLDNFQQATVFAWEGYPRSGLSDQDRLLSPKTDCLMSINDQPRTVDPDSEVVRYDFIRMPNDRFSIAIDRSTTMGRRKIRAFSSRANP